MKKKLILIGLGLLLLVGMGATGRALYYKSNDAFMQGNDIGIAVLAVRNDTLAALTDTDGDYAPLQVNAAGELYTAANVTAMVPGTAAASLGKAEEGTHASGDTGVMILTIRDDSPAATAADGKYAALLSNSTGELLVADDTLATAVGTTNTSIGVTSSAKADVDGNGAVNAHLRRIGFEADRAGDFLSTIDADTGNIDTSLNNIETDVESMVHGGKTLATAKIDIDLTGGTDSAQIIAASGSEVIYVVELLVNTNTQCNLQFTDGSETASTSGLELYLASYGGLHLKRTPGYRFALDASEGMFLDDIAAGTVNVRGYVWYYQE